MKILILGAAGQIAQLVRNMLQKDSRYELVLYARDIERRLKKVNDQETLVSGDFLDEKKLAAAMSGVDLVYLNDMGNPEAVQLILDQMKDNHVTRFIGTSILGIYDEVAGEFGEWNHRMIGSSARTQAQKESAHSVENSSAVYTLLRLTWLYNDPMKVHYQLTKKGEPFVGAQVSRQAVAKLITDIIESDGVLYQNESLGVSEPGSEKLNKPRFN